MEIEALKKDIRELYLMIERIERMQRNTRKRAPNQTYCRECKHYERSHKYGGPFSYGACDVKQVSTHANCCACDDFLST